jgi:hypothetical protein
MFVSIDMDNLVFLHKHHEHDTLSALSWLECGTTVSITVESTDRAHFLSKMSSLDLAILYRNTTGASVVTVGNDNLALRQHLAELVDHMPPTLALAEEVQQQVLAVEDRLHAGERFKYALGARTPAAPQELFPLRAPPLTEGQLTASAARALGRMAAPAAANTAGTAESAPKPALKARASSVKPEIWAHADKVWEEVGRPTDRAVVMELRKRMMKELEEQKGIKRTSSSNELGNWMKDRVK